MIKETQVDGVTTLITPHSGPLAAGLVFRVGCADEPLPRRGITHLVEHLALHRHGLTDHHANAATSATTAHFFTSGSEADVVSYLTSVCRSLHDLPLDRLPMEKTILRTEQAGRAGGSLAAWRYGARGYGSAGSAEWGLDVVTADDVREWAASRFTRENAVLWIAGDSVPAGLDLVLPSGVRHPMPEVTSALPAMPAYFAEGSREVKLTSIVRRSTAASIFAMLLERTLFRTLRQQDGNSYAAAAGYTPRDAEFATIHAYADALPEKQDAVLGGLVDVLAGLRVGRIDADELTLVRDKALAALEHPDAGRTILAGDALDVLFGRERTPIEECRAQLAAVSVADMREVAAEAMSTLLLQVPSGRTADWAGFSAAPVWSSHTVVGGEFRSLESPDITLVVGDEGVSVVGPHGTSTVRYEDCVLMQCWPDGGRMLVGADGIAAGIEPALYDVPAGTVAGLEEQVDPAVVVWQPARPDNRIPRPKIPTPPVAPPSPERKYHIALAALGLLTLVLIAMMVVLLLSRGS